MFAHTDVKIGIMRFENKSEVNTFKLKYPHLIEENISITTQYEQVLPQIKKP